MAGRAGPGLAISMGLHGLAVLALMALPRDPLPPVSQQPVALVWAEQTQGAGDPADSVETTAAAPDAAPAQAEAAVMQAASAPLEPVPEMPNPVAEAPPSETAMSEPAPPSRESDMAPLPQPPPPAPAQPSRAPARIAQPSTPAPSPAQSPLHQAATPDRAAGAGEATGAVTPPRQSSAASNPPPSYPYASRLRNEQGRVTLRVGISPVGRAIDVTVLHSSGFRALDESAMTAVRQWLFEPAMRDGEAVFSTTSIGITFTLEGDRRW